MFLFISLSLMSMCGLFSALVSIKRNRFKEKEYDPLKTAYDNLQGQCREFGLQNFLLFSNVDGLLSKNKDDLVSNMVIENKSFRDWKNLESQLDGRKNQESYLVLIKDSLNDKKKSLSNVEDELFNLKKNNAKYLKMYEDEQEALRQQKRAEEKKKADRRKKDEEDRRIASTYAASSSYNSSSSDYSSSSSSSSDWSGGGGSSSGGGSSDSW